MEDNGKLMSVFNVFESLKKKNNELVNGILNPRNFPEGLSIEQINDLGILNLRLEAAIFDLKRSNCTEDDLITALNHVIAIENEANAIHTI